MWQIIKSASPQSNTSKLAMRQLDRFATETGVGWKRTLMIAGEVVGKTKGLSIGECKKVIEEIKRRRGR